MEKSHEKNLKNIQDFANKHKLVFEDNGEIGFGRECVGLLHGDNYIEYNPMDSDFNYMPDFYDERFNNIAPENAYHKGDYLAVLGTGESAISELSQWVDSLKEIGVEIGNYPTGATGLQAMISGFTAYAIKPIK